MYQEDKKTEDKNEDQLFLEYRETGDEECFIQLFSMIDPWIYNVAFYLIGDHAIAGDIIQDTWLKVIDNKEKFDPDKGNFRNYFYTAVKYASINVNIKTQREVHIPLDSKVFSSDPEAQQDLKEISGLLRSALKKVRTKNHQDAITLHYFGGMKIAEIADLKDTTDQNIKNWLHRGRLSLNKELRRNKEIESVLEKFLMLKSIMIILLV